jgi:Co/Zn/Cd efflux system component
MFAEIGTDGFILVLGIFAIVIGLVQALFSKTQRNMTEGVLVFLVGLVVTIMAALVMIIGSILDNI